jgi:hypothetical protein
MTQLPASLASVPFLRAAARRHLLPRLFKGTSRLQPIHRDR